MSKAIVKTTKKIKSAYNSYENENLWMRKERKFDHFSARIQNISERVRIVSLKCHWIMFYK